MPGDSSKPINYKKDSLKVESKNNDSLKQVLSPHTLQPEKKLHNFFGIKISDDAYASIWVAIVIPLVIFLYKTFLPKLIKPSVILTAFSGKFLIERKAHFIPNNFKIFNYHNEDISSPDLENTNNSIEYFINKILSNDHFCYFLIAPTGVGKTTYLCNLFVEYKQVSRWKNVGAVLLLGKMYDKETIAKIKEIIKQGRAKETILLLDAMDEFDAQSNNLSLQEYKEKFFNEWNEDRELFALFKKVIVSVREQFLQPDDFDKLKINSKRIFRIHLQPFTFDQIGKYIENRYKNEDEAVLKSIKALVKEAKTKKLEFIKLPLLLNYLPDISKGVQIVGKERFVYNSYNIYKLITQQWLIREEEEKDISVENQCVNLQEFCENLAFYISHTGEEYRIKIAEFEAFEKTQKAILITKGLSDRSLLVKESVITTVGREKHEDIYLKFVHSTFLEFFLVLYSEARIPNVEADVSNNINIPFAQYSFALQTFIEHRWHQYKTDIPKQHPSFNYNNNIVPLSKLIEWKHFFDKLTLFNETREPFINQMETLLDEIDISWQQRLGWVKNLNFTNVNFWNFEKNTPYQEAQKAALYLKPFITKIEFEDIDIADSHLNCFNETKNITSLIIKNSSKQIGTGLKNFSLSANNLEVLILENLNLTDEHLAYFKDGKRIKILNLGSNKLDGSGLKNFAECAESVEKVYLYKNSITDDYLDCFNDAKTIKILNLNSNKLNGLGLKNFAGCAKNLEELGVGENSITDEHLAYFENVQKIKVLALYKNKLNGSGLKNFTGCAEGLEELGLGENSITDEHLAYFNNAGKVKKLGLYKNRFNGSGLKNFAGCSKSIEELYLWENSITDEHLAYFNNAQKIKKLNLAKNKMSGSGLKNFTGCAENLEELNLGENSITDEHLAYFNNAQKIKVLALYKNKLNGSGLKNFTGCAEGLEELGLGETNITDDHLVYFTGAKKIKSLDLCKNRLNGSGLKNFAGCAKSMEKLYLWENGITDEHLSYFDSSQKIKKLNLAQNRLSGSGLKNFAGCAESLEKLGLAENSITDEHLDYFNGAKKIKLLDLSENRLNGSGLKNFAECAKSMEELYLWKNSISDEHLAYFDSAQNIKKLSLSQNKLKGLGLQSFSASAKNLEELYLSTNDFSNECLKYFQNATKIKILRLSNNKIDADGLKNFKECAGSLEELYLIQNVNLKNIDFAFQFKNLKKLNIAGCPVEDMDSIEKLRGNGVEVITEE